VVVKRKAEYRQGAKEGAKIARPENAKERLTDEVEGGYEWGELSNSQGKEKTPSSCHGGTAKII